MARGGRHGSRGRGASVRRRQGLHGSKERGQAHFVIFKLGSDGVVVAVVVIEAVEVAVRAAGCAKVRKDYGRFSLLLLWRGKRL